MIFIKKLHSEWRPNRAKGRDVNAPHYLSSCAYFASYYTNAMLTMFKALKHNGFRTYRTDFKLLWKLNGVSCLILMHSKIWPPRKSRVTKNHLLQYTIAAARDIFSESRLRPRCARVSAQVDSALAFERFYPSEYLWISLVWDKP